MRLISEGAKLHGWSFYITLASSPSFAKNYLIIGNYQCMLLTRISKMRVNFVKNNLFSTGLKTKFL